MWLSAMRSSNKREVSRLRTWIEISKNNLLDNISEIKKALLPKTKFMAVVKSNAYGHGLLLIANSIKSKVDYFAVFNLEDALELRLNKIKKPILVLSPIALSDASLAIKNDIEVMASNLDFLKKAKAGLKVHICVDTGLGRDGFPLNQIDEVIKTLKKSSVNVVGLYGHFAAADDKNFDKYSAAQAEEILYWRDQLKHFGIEPKLIHHSASAGIFFGKNKVDFNLVRVGAGIYGLWPNDDQKRSVKIKPILSWKARVSEVKLLSKGSAISYGCTHVLQRDSKIALLPIGYFDGISRVSSNKSLVILNGKKVRQLGRVTMNLIVVDVTDLEKVAIGDVATIIGFDKKQQVSAEDWANWSQTSNYEIVTKINPVITRVLS